jgi:hypothetical protein
MLTALVLTAVSQAQFIDLEGVGDDDRPTAVVFTPDGSAVLIAHATGGINRVAFTGGPVTHAVAGGPSYEALEFAPSGAVLVAGDFDGGTVDAYSAAGFGFLRSIPFSIAGANRLIVGLGSQYAVVIGTSEVAWLDLVAGGQLSTITLPPFDVQSYPHSKHRAVLSDDDRTLIALEGNTWQRSLVALDLATGATIATLPGVAGLSGTSGDRRRLIAVGFGGVHSTATIHEYDSRTLQFIERTRIFQVEAVQDIALDAAADRCILSTVRGAYEFPLDGADHDPSQPGVTTLRVTHPWRQIASGDLSRVLFLAEEAAVLDVAGVANTRLPLSYESYDTILATTSASAASGARFALATADRVKCIEAGPGAPAGLARDVNTGVGPEQDGHFLQALLLDTDRALVLARDSDNVLDVDLARGIVRGVLPVGRGPSCFGTRADGVVLFGCNDGTVVLVDPAGFIEVGRFSVGDAVVQLACEPTGSNAWIRTEGRVTNQLVRVDSSATAPVISAAVPLAGPGEGTFGRPSVAFDFARQRAFVASRDPYVIEWVDLVQAVVQDEHPSSGSDLALAPDGNRLYSARRAYPPFVLALDIAPMGLSERWRAETMPVYGYGPWVTEGLALDATGDTVFVNLTVEPEPPATSAGFVALDADTGALRSTLGDMHSAGCTFAEGTLFMSTGLGLRIVRYESGAFGPVELVTSPQGCSNPPVVDAARGRVVVATGDHRFQPVASGLAVFDLFASRVTEHCTGGAPNATGVQAMMTLEGSPFAGGEVTAVVSGLEPNGMFGVVLVGDAVSAPAPAPGGPGELCIGGTFGRLVAPPRAADAGGVQRHRIDTGPLVTSAGAWQVMPGDTAVFQLWHRDSAPAGSVLGNMSTAVELKFR